MLHRKERNGQQGDVEKRADRQGNRLLFHVPTKGQPVESCYDKQDSDQTQSPSDRKARQR